MNVMDKEFQSSPSQPQSDYYFYLAAALRS